MQIEDYRREIITIFFIQKNTILTVTLFIFLSSLLIAFFWPPTYSANGSILLKGKKAERSPDALDREDVRTMPIGKEDLASEIQILSSPDVIENTIKYLREKKLYRQYKKDASIYKEIYALKDRIKTEIVPASKVINVTFFSNDQDYAVIVLDTLMQQYILYRLEVYNPAMALEFFNKQAMEYKTNIEKKEIELMERVKKTGAADPIKEIENNLTIKADLEKQLNQLRIEAIDKENTVVNLSKDISLKKVQSLTLIDNITTITDIMSSLNNLYIERGNLLRKFHSENKRITLINKQISDTENRVMDEIVSYRNDISRQLEIVKKKITNIENRLETIKALNVELKQQLVDTQRIDREAALLNSAYEIFAKRRQEARLNSDNKSSGFFITILDKAFPSNGKVFPKKRIVIPFGLVIGFITGCSLGFVREYFANTFKRPSDVEVYTQIPVLFSIPFKEDLQKMGELPANP